MSGRQHKGACNCGEVSFTISGELAEPSVCHCTQCRRQTGYCWSSTHIPKAALTFQSEAALVWYQSSPNVQRGFCGTCGCFLFWNPEDEDKISVSMGALDAPTGVKIGRHIFVADKGDYYDLADGLPQSS